MGLVSELTKSPGLLALGALAIGLFVFRDRISGFFSDITGGAAGTAQIAETGGILARNLQSNLTATPLPTDPLFGQQGFFTETVPTAIIGAGEGIGDFFGGITKAISDAISSIIPEADAEIAPVPIPTEPTFFGDVGAAESRARQEPINIEPVIQQTVGSFNVQSQIPDQQFQGFGVGFEGGVIRETPTEFLSLSQIIDKFMVTASQAADIRAQAQGFTPAEEEFLRPRSIVFDEFGGALAGSQITEPAVSDPQFSGLTPEQIFQQLVGGVISNF